MERHGGGVGGGTEKREKERERGVIYLAPEICQPPRNGSATHQHFVTIHV